MSRPKVTPQTCPRGTKIQSVLMDKGRFKYPSQAKVWLKDHKFRRTLDEKPNTFRARQLDPSAFKSRSFRTITLTKGIKAVVGCPKK